MEADPRVRTEVGRADRRRTTAPTISVVIMSTDPEAVLESRISSICCRFDPAGAEYVLVWAGSGRLSGDFKRRFPHVHFVSTAPGTSSAELRVQGIKAATGDIVLLVRQDGSAMPGISRSVESNSVEGDLVRSSSPRWFLQQAQLR